MNEQGAYGRFRHARLGQFLEKRNQLWFAQNSIALNVRPDPRLLDSRGWVDLYDVTVQSETEHLSQVRQDALCHANNVAFHHRVDDQLDVGLGDVSGRHFANDGEDVALEPTLDFCTAISARFELARLLQVEQTPHRDSRLLRRQLAQAISLRLDRFDLVGLDLEPFDRLYL